jgi:hypothetical protein
VCFLASDPPTTSSGTTRASSTSEGGKLKEKMMDSDKVKASNSIPANINIKVYLRMAKGKDMAK